MNGAAVIFYNLLVIFIARILDEVEQLLQEVPLIRAVVFLANGDGREWNPINWIIRRFDQDDGWIVHPLCKPKIL